ncbi:hypothetical protein TrLO_g15174 [Triparma laevis f. longispina]|uniref:Sugar phosphate phosphatase n=1 Tax=Triparma laevis f. longispina TaxID=1714387 RepID=A0A9W7KY19_9STRA|nr:hypothetical protein TrLO_g15174 [Triparma laevis f. longispina]
MKLHPSATMPPPLTSSTPNTWAYDTMYRRVDRDILRRLEDENSEEFSTPEFQEAKLKIADLRNELRNSAPIRHINDTGPDLSSWHLAMSDIVSNQQTYLTAPWLAAEFYVYRRVLECFDYFNPSSKTFKFDPFLKQKRSGLQTSVASSEALLKKFSKLPPKSSSAGLNLAILSALWGNKMDLSIWPADDVGGVDVFSDILEEASGNLLWDDTDRLISDMLARGSPGENGNRVHIVVDNAGFELVTDLALADFLISSGVASCVTFQLKKHPTFVSDAMESDLLETVEYFGGLDGASNPFCVAASERWKSYLANNQWICSEDFYWVQPHPMWDMPTHLSSTLSSTCDVCFVKGDANYRRLIGDLKWDYVTDSFQDVVGSYFPCDVVALRTLKAEVGCGMVLDSVEVAKEKDPSWQVDGKWGVVHYGKTAK